MLTRSRFIASGLINPFHSGKKVAAGGGGGFSFNMTAGDFSGIQGYSDGTLIGAFGSIDGEPIPGEVLTFCISGVSNAVGFHGNIVATLTGLTVWVDSVEYPFDSVDWAYDAENDATQGIWDTAGPTFVNTNSYFIEIK